MALGVAVLGGLFFPECRAAVQVWMTSTAYGHCFLVLPMAAYLIWDRREALRGLQAQPTAAFAWLALPIAAGWFAAERLGIMEGRQIMALGALELLFLSVLGVRLFRALAGPLLYLIFLVPFGAFLTPVLQDFTAAYSAIGLKLLGIPAYVTDLTIEISAGTFYVAEACAGLRFLIAAVAFGVFYALLNYRSPGRRAVFIAASIIVPIMANGARALGIVVLGHILGSAEAAAADHVIYGWGFFSVIMLLLVVGGMPWRETPAPPGPPMRAAGPGRHPGPLWPAVAVCLLSVAGPAAAGLLNLGIETPRLAALPLLAVPPGCTQAASTPVSEDYAVVRIPCNDRSLTVTIAVLPRRSPPDWLQRERARLTVLPDAEDTGTSVLRTADPANGQWTLVESKSPDRYVGVAAWVGGTPARGGLAGRLQQARDSMLGSPYAPMLMTVMPDVPPRMTSADRLRSQELIRQFVDSQHGLTGLITAAAQLP